MPGASLGDWVQRFATETPDALAAIDDEGAAISYAALVLRADLLRAELGGERRLLLLEGGATVDWLVAYVAALRGQHPVLIAPADNPAVMERLERTFMPAFSLSAAGSFRPVAVPDAPAIALHPDLALLLSTSGSTGSAKCVRLSQANLEANAASIGAYLVLTADERGVVSLPTHYSYGLSIVNSHLRAGATLLLTRRSVIDPDFWSFCGAHGATSFAGVPHSYDLLSRIDFAAQAPASLRYFTQAGGRLPEAQVRRFAELAAERGWRFYVMYGQTEATARMAYVPAGDLLRKVGSIGVAIPGGRFRLIDEAGGAITTPDQVGELVYEGPNVMMGYATAPEELAAGGGPSVLHTGDLASVDEDGFHRIAGRLSRFVKIFGNRIGLDDVEQILAERGLPALATGIDDHLLVVTRDVAAAEPIAAIVRDRLKLPEGYFTVRAVEEYPLLPSGKIDYASLKASIVPPGERPGTGGTGPELVRAAFRSVFGAAAEDESASFASLGGDSLNYVSVAVALEQALPDLPQGWTHLSIGALATRAEGAVPAAPGARTTLPRNLDTLRALACALVVIYHVVGMGANSGLHLATSSLSSQLVNGLDPVRMPLFAAMAGFLYAAMPAPNDGIGPFMARKVRALLVPMLTVGLISWAARDAVHGDFAALPGVLLHGYLHLWFMYALTVIFLIAALVDCYFGMSWRLWAWLPAAAVVLALVTPFVWLFSLSSALRLLPFFAFGVLLHRRPALIGAPLLLALAAAAAIAVAVQQLDAAHLSMWPDERLVAFAGGCGIVLLALRFFPRLAWLEPLGAYSFTIYLWHPTANAAVRGVLLAFGAPLALLFVLGVAAGILLPVVLHKLAARLPHWISLPLVGR